MAPLVGLALLVAVAFAPAAHASHVQTVRADFSKSTPVGGLVGFTHGMNAQTPPDDRIVPLAPTLWRSRFIDVPYKRAMRLGGRYTFVLSNRYGYPGDGARAPYEDWKRWRRLVRNAARNNRNRQIVWDVWNEPDLEHFWRGTREQYYETYRIAYEELRAVLGPDVTVSGPSTTSYRPDWIEGLLSWCQTRGCQVNALSWHELSRGSIPAVGDRVSATREQFLENPRWRGLGLRELHVSEAVGEHDQYLPGENVGYLGYLEKGGADAAARACWPSLDGQSNCYNDTLAGLLVPGTSQPRSVWWATRAYAEGAASRVLTRFGDSHVVGLASSGSAKPDSAQLLIANLKRRTGSRRSRSSVNVRVTLRKVSRLSFLRRAKRVKVAIEKFPATGEAPLTAPRRRRASKARIRDGEVLFTLHGVRPHEVYRLTFSRG